MDWGIFEDIINEHYSEDQKGGGDMGALCEKAYLMGKQAPSSSLSSDGLDALLEVVKDIRKSDCGGWLKDCNGLFNCRDGREKRNELMRLLDKLYKAASI